MIEVQLLSKCSVTQLESISRVRFSTWSALGFQGTYSDVVDGHDLHASHLLAWYGNVLVGSIRVCFHHLQSGLPDEELYRSLVLPASLQYCGIGRLVIIPGKQGRGVGVRLATRAVQLAKVAEYTGICAVTVPVMTALALQLGFVELGRTTSRFVPNEVCSVMFLRSAQPSEYLRNN